MSKQIGVSALIDPELHAQLKQYADSDRRSMISGNKGATKAVKTKVCLDCGKPLEVRDATSSWSWDSGDMPELREAILRDDQGAHVGINPAPCGAAEDSRSLPVL